MKQVALAVLGVPAPQGSKSAVVRGNRAVLIEGASTSGRAKHRAWRHAVTAEALEAANRHGSFSDLPVQVDVTFWMPKPKSRPKSALWCDRKPDLDKLVRSTLDGLADGGLLLHDSRVVVVAAAKRYASGPTGAAIVVRIRRDGLWSPYSTPEQRDTFTGGTDV